MKRRRQKKMVEKMKVRENREETIGIVKMNKNKHLKYC
jgi:hypothetical protein